MRCAVLPVIGWFLVLPSVCAFVSIPTTTTKPKPVVSTFHHHVAVLPKHRMDSMVRMARNPAEEVEPFLEKADKNVFDRVIRVANHLPVIGSLMYFGLISMKSMMPGGIPKGTIVSAITSYVGPVSSRAFSDKFPTLITPARYVFFIWPVISAVQLATVAFSALRPKNTPLLSQDELSALLLANIASTWWIVASSQAIGLSPPLSCFLILPLVPLVSGYPLRVSSRSVFSTDPDKFEIKNLIFQIYSSFTTLASLVALTVELQHGGRVPWVRGKPEVAAAIFLASSFAAVALPGQSVVRKWVYAGTVGGILWRRVTAALAIGASGLTKSLLSVSFLGTVVLFGATLKNLIEEYKDD